MVPGQTTAQPSTPTTPTVEGATGFNHSLAAAAQNTDVDDVNNLAKDKYKEMLAGMTSPPPYSETDPAVIEGVVLDGK